MVKIYYLMDPETNQIRYVGKTVSTLRERLYSHIYNTKIKTHKSGWIKSLKTRGLKPTIELIEEVSDDIWADEERFYISYFRFLGFDLTNMSDGGELDNTGKKFSKETVGKMSRAQLGKRHTLESKNKMSISKSGEGNHSSKLTRSQVEEIRKKYIPREYSYAKIATEYGVATATIQNIIEKRHWR